MIPRSRTVKKIAFCKVARTIVRTKAVVFCLKVTSTLKLRLPCKRGTSRKSDQMKLPRYYQYQEKRHIGQVQGTESSLNQLYQESAEISQSVGYGKGRVLTR